MHKNDDIKIAVIGLGYVGFPLFIEFSRKFTVVGYDISKQRIKELQAGLDKTLEYDGNTLTELNTKLELKYTFELSDISDCNFFIITVPTPIDEHRHPDLNPLFSATQAVGTVLKKGDFVIYESTVYPGATEEDCVPILEQESKLVFNKDFYCGYSPERINPGDKKHTIVDIIKVTSGSTPEAAEKIDDLYKSIITAGTYKAPNIKVAEAAKVIENCQRDLNIAFVNELAMIFHKMSIPTSEVLKAASTKWNFLPFKPGLVGGHCIGVDPYYLTHKAQELGFNPEIILAGRRINDGMGTYIASRVIKLLIRNNKKVKDARVLILGITFKENCPDIRNSRVIDVIKELEEFGCAVNVVDPMAIREDVQEEYGLSIHNNLDDVTLDNYEAVVLAVAHKEFLSLDFASDNSQIIFDVKSCINGSNGAL